MTASPDRRPDVDEDLELLAAELEVLRAQLLDLVRRLRMRASA